MTRPVLRSLLALLFAALVLPAPGAAQIRCGETISRVIFAPALSDEVKFDAAAGEVVSITAAAVPFPDSGLHDLRWEVRDSASGAFLPTGDGEPSCAGQCETVPLPRSGTFRIRVFDPSQNGFGEYHLTLEAVSETANGKPNGPPTPTCARPSPEGPDGTRVITRGQPTSGIIQVHGETDTFTFLGEPGEALLITVTSAAGSLVFEPRWELFDPHGRPVRTDDGLRACPGACGTAPLPLAGTYTIKVSDTGFDARGTYTLLLTGAPAPTSTTTTVPDDTTTSSSSTSTTTIADDSTTTTTTVAEDTTSTTTAPEDTTSSTTAPADTTTSTSSTTSTTGGPAPTLPPPPFALEQTARGGTGDAGEVGAAVAVRGDTLLLGAPGDGTSAPGAGSVFVLAFGGTPGSPGFGTLLDTLGEPGTPAAGHRFGAAVAAIGDATLVGAPGAQTGGAAYLLRPGTEPLTLLPPTTDPDADFGFAVAALGQDLLVGAPGTARDTLPRVGRVYLFSSTTGAPLLVFENPASSEGGDGFGFAIATAGANVLVGAPGTEETAGAAFLLEGGTARLLLTLQNPTPEAGDQFGFAVASSGSFLIVAAPGLEQAAGRVFVFDATTGALLRTLAKPAPRPNDRFGSALALTTEGLLVGAPGDSDAAPNGGAAYLFDLDTGALRRVIRKGDPAPDDRFGASLAQIGERLFVGAPGDDVGTVDGGAGYLVGSTGVEAVLRRRLSATGFGSAVASLAGDVLVGAPASNGAGTVERVDATGETTLTIENPDGPTSRFGFAVAAAGTSVLVGAPFEDTNGEHVGAAYLFDGPNLRLRLMNPEPVPGDQFGFAVAAVGDDVLVGAPLAGRNDTGAVHLLDGATGVRRLTFRKPTPVTGDFFGAAVAAEGDGVLVGAPSDSAAAPNAGAAYLFARQTAALDRVFKSPAPGSGDLFGAAVALSASQVVIGAPLADSAADDAGRVYIFDRTSGALRLTLDNPTPGRGDQFGHAVAIVDDKNVLVGAPLDDGRATDTGAAYLFDGTTGMLLETVLDPLQGEFDRFGFAVAAGPSTLLVGAPGAARVYAFDGERRSTPLAGRSRLRAAVVMPVGVCGNGIVEGTEACDDGNQVDLDDCHNDCTRPACCTFDPLAADRCDDHNPCTDDVLDGQAGCLNVPNDACACGPDSSCASGKCRLCVGCFLFPWDCCNEDGGGGSVCLAVSPECTGTACLAAPYCECAGGLDCGSETVPAKLGDLFTGACDRVRLAEGLVPEGTPAGEPELAAVRGHARAARKMTKKAVRMARGMAPHTLSRACRTAVLHKVKAVKTAIPRPKALRSCVLGS